MDKTEINLFGDYLKYKREYCGVTLEELAEGLCTAAILQEMEENQRLPGKSMQERLLARLGESGYDFECMLFSEDYKIWELQRDILDALDNREVGRADALLGLYDRELSNEDMVSRQFLLVMQLQRMELAGASKEECRMYLKEAVALTIPEPEQTGILPVLSIQELNLLLEYFDYQPEATECRYEEIQKRLQSERYESEYKAMLAAKTACFYSRFLKKKTEAETAPSRKKQLLQKARIVCSEGLETLRDCSKTYFLFELLEVQYAIGNLCLQENCFLGEERLQLQAEQEQNRRFYQVFDALYTEFSVPKETNGFTCFYRQWEIYCINDVIWARRNMLGLSREDLSIACGKNTLERLERQDKEKRTKVHRGVAQRIFKELRLPLDFERAQIITDDAAVLRMEKQYRWLCNQSDYEEAGECLQNIKQHISMENLINRQYVDYEETFLAFKLNRITREEYLAEAVKTLEYTIPYQVALAEIKEVRPRHGAVREGRKYLTNMECTILANLGSASDAEGSLVYWRALKEYCDWLEEQCTLAPIIRRYSFIMSCVANQYGSNGWYEESNAISRKIVREELRLHSVDGVERAIYNLLWNDRTEKGLPLVVEDLVWKQGLLTCLELNVFSKDIRRKNRVLEKLKK